MLRVQRRELHGVRRAQLALREPQPLERRLDGLRVLGRLPRLIPRAQPEGAARLLRRLLQRQRVRLPIKEAKEAWCVRVRGEGGRKETLAQGPTRSRGAPAAPP